MPWAIRIKDIYNSRNYLKLIAFEHRNSKIFIYNSRNYLKLIATEKDIVREYDLQ